MKYREYKIDKEYKNIYYFLKDNAFSENYIKNLRKVYGYIRVNSKIVNIKQSLSIDDILEIAVSPNNKTTIMHCVLPLDIVYEDTYYLLVYKKSGLSCMPNKSHYSENLAGAICNYMKDKDENFTLRIINRLDKDTAGIIIVAKDSISQKDIKDINKTYHAVCKGKIDKSMMIDKKIKTINKNGINNIKRVVAEDGMDAKTFIKPIKSNDKMSLISITLEHGRTHQIRVHMSSIGHALIGDEIYGEKSEIISHTALVCNNLSFYHPYKRKILNFSIPFPEDFKSLIHNIK